MAVNSVMYNWKPKWRRRSTTNILLLISKLLHFFHFISSYVFSIKCNSQKIQTQKFQLIQLIKKVTSHCFTSKIIRKIITYYFCDNFFYLEKKFYFMRKFNNSNKLIQLSYIINLLGI